VPWRFSDAGCISVGRARHCRRPKTYTQAEGQSPLFNPRVGDGMQRRRYGEAEISVCLDRASLYLSTAIRNYGDVFFCEESGRDPVEFCFDLGEQVMEVAACEGPFERFCGFLISLLEPDQISFEICEGGKIVRSIP